MANLSSPASIGGELAGTPAPSLEDTNHGFTNNDHEYNGNDTDILPSNHTFQMSKIFLQTAAAQGISGFFAFAAMVITCHQVGNISLTCTCIYSLDQVPQSIHYKMQVIPFYETPGKTVCHD